MVHWLSQQMWLLLMFLAKTCLEKIGLFYFIYFQNYQYNSPNLYHKVCYIIQLKYIESDKHYYDTLYNQECKYLIILTYKIQCNLFF